MIDKEELATLIPHKGKMLLLSSVSEYNMEERYICSEYHLSEECIFYDSAMGGVPAWVGFEFMAQSIAVISGLTCREMGIKPKMGFILSVSSMVINLPFFKGKGTVRIRMKEIDFVDQIYTFEGKVFWEDKTVMEGKLTVMNATDEQVMELMEKGK